MSACLVSILMPAYNAGDTIDQTVDSILAQSFTDFELIIVNDGSRDDTAEKCANLARRDDRIQYHFQANTGQSMARNKALSLSRGKYVSWIDSDDLWHREKLARQLLLMDGRRNLFVLTGNQTFMGDGDERELGAITLPPLVQGKGYGVQQILQVSLQQMVLINTALVDRQTMERLGGWDASKWTAEDWHLWIRASVESAFAVVSEPLVLYRKHSNSLTAGQDYAKVVTQHEEIISQACKQGLVSRRGGGEALLTRRLSACGDFIYMQNLAEAARVFCRILSQPRAWRRRQAWERGAEIVRLLGVRLLSGAQ